MTGTYINNNNYYLQNLVQISIILLKLNSCTEIDNKMRIITMHRQLQINPLMINFLPFFKSDRKIAPLKPSSIFIYKM